MPRTLAARHRYEAELIKGSRFIATLAPVADESAARDLLDELRAEWPDASHHCWAWRLASPAIDRAGDDGEPGGSAGRPILAALTGREVVDTAVIVTRWFGGTKLGVGGLVRAYGGTAAQALDDAELVEWVAQTTVEFEHEHADTGPVDRALQLAGAEQLNADWGTVVRRSVVVTTSELDGLWSALGDATSGRVAPRSSDANE